MKIFKFILIFLMASNFSSFDLKSQEVLWEYHLTEDVYNTAEYFWVDDEGNSTINIARRKEFVEEKRTSFQEGYLIKLSSEGIFEEAMFIKHCRNRTRFLPFGENYLTYGNNCLGVDEKYSYDFRLFSQKGDLMKIGEPLPDIGTRSSITDKQITFFSRERGYHNYGFLYIGNLDEDLKVSYDSISMKALRIEGHGMSLNGSPARLGRSTWAIPVAFGEPGKYVRESLELKHGGFFVVHNNKIEWKFTPEKRYYYTERIASFGKKLIVLFMGRNRIKKYIKTYSKKGELLDEFSFSSGYVLDMKISNDQIVLLTSKKIIYYSLDGELLNEVMLPEMSRVNRMAICKDHSIIVGGVRDKRSYIVKIGEKEEESTLEELDENKNEEELIKYSSIDMVSEELTSVNIFPNPTAKTLNFTIKNGQTAADIESCVIEVYTTNGKLIVREILNFDNAQLDVGNLISGTYIYRILINDSKQLSGQFVKI